MQERFITGAVMLFGPDVHANLLVWPKSAPVVYSNFPEIHPELQGSSKSCAIISGCSGSFGEPFTTV